MENGTDFQCETCGLPFRVPAAILKPAFGVVTNLTFIVYPGNFRDQGVLKCPRCGARNLKELKKLW